MAKRKATNKKASENHAADKEKYPIHHAIISGEKEEDIKKLIEQHPDKLIPNDAGLTPWSLAVVYKREDVKLLFLGSSAEAGNTIYKEPDNEPDDALSNPFEQASQPKNVAMLPFDGVLNNPYEGTLQPDDPIRQIYRFFGKEAFAVNHPKKAKAALIAPGVMLLTAGGVVAIVFTAGFAAIPFAIASHAIISSSVGGGIVTGLSGFGLFKAVKGDESSIQQQPCGETTSAFTVN